MTAAPSRRRQLAPQLVAVCLAACAVNVLMTQLQDRLPHVAAETATPAGQGLGAWLSWILANTNEAQFYATWYGGVGLLLGAGCAHAAARRRHAARGFDISYGSGLWPWVVASAICGLVLSNVLWGWTLADGTWQPTFVPFVSVPPAIVLIYGGGWRVGLTAVVLGAALTTPVSLAVLRFVCEPLGLPGVVANVSGMWVGALIAFALCRRLPWMHAPKPAQETADPSSAAPVRAWYPRRILADFSEAQFYGNEWASAGLIGGALVGWFLNALGPAYGTGVLPDILTAQVLTAAVAVWFYADGWQRHGWYPTFVPVVSLAPAAVIALDGGWAAIVVSAVSGAIAGPALARAVASRLPGDFHPFIGSVVSMTVLTAVGVPLFTTLQEAGVW